MSTSFSQQLDYNLTLQYPSDILPFASSFDSHIWFVLENIVSQHIPEHDEGGDIECVVNVPQVPQLSGRSFQMTIIRQPIKLGGLGLRSQAETCPAAFLGGIEMSIPHMVNLENEDIPTGVCPQLVELVGEVVGFSRWSTLLSSGCRTATEFSWAWNLLAEEAACKWQYIQKEPS